MKPTGSTPLVTPPKYRPSDYLVPMTPLDVQEARVANLEARGKMIKQLETDIEKLKKMSKKK